MEREPDPLRRLAALAAFNARARPASPSGCAVERLRDRLVGLAPPWPLDPSGDKRPQRHALYRLGAERYRDLALLIAAEGGMAAARSASYRLWPRAGPRRIPCSPGAT